MVAGIPAIFNPSSSEAAVMLTGGDGEVLATPPSNVRKGGPLQTTSSAEHRIFAFEEIEYTLPTNSNFTVPALVANTGPSSSFGPGGVFPMSGDTSASGFLPEGIAINSYYFTMDPTGNPTRSASFEFDEEIIGFAFLIDSLDGSDPLWGVPGTLYPTGVEFDPNGSRKLETAVDFFSYVVEVDENADMSTLDLTMRVDRNSLDNIRVFTIPFDAEIPIPPQPGPTTPEPSALVGLATLGLLGLSSARRRLSN